MQVNQFRWTNGQHLSLGRVRLMQTAIECSAQHYIVVVWVFFCFLFFSLFACLNLLLEQYAVIVLLSMFRNAMLSSEMRLAHSK